MDEESGRSKTTSASKSGSESWGNSSKLLQPEARNMQPTAKLHGDKRSANYVDFVSKDSVAESRPKNPLQLSKRTAQPLVVIDSPTSDYESGTFVSLEQAEGPSGRDSAAGGDPQATAENVAMTVGENVEVSTEQEDSERGLSRPESGAKRTKAQLSRDKVPRVGDFIFMQGASPLSICMPLIFPTVIPSATATVMPSATPTIMATTTPTIRFLTTEDQKRGGTPTAVVADNRPRPLRPRSHMFEDIAELSKSDRRDRSKVCNSSGSGEEEAEAQKFHSLNECLNLDMKAATLPGGKDRTCSSLPLSLPHPPSPSSHGKEDSEQEPSEGYHSMEWSKGDKPPGPHNALLQVSEAHLAILPDEDGDTPLHLAVTKENFPLTQYLVRLITGVNLNLDIANNMRQTPLHLAVITKQPLMVQLLVTSGASVNFPDRRGCTSIHLAAQRRDLRILQILSRATNPIPDFNAKNFAGLTAVHVAAKEASIDILKYLFQAGSNKNSQDASSGRTPLHYAVELESFQLTNFFLENGCQVNAATYAGNTPLHIAAGRKLKEVVALLMAYGANPAIPNGEGDFPSDLPASLLMQRAKMTNSS